MTWRSPVRRGTCVSRFASRTRSRFRAAVPTRTRAWSTCASGGAGLASSASTWTPRRSRTSTPACASRVSHNLRGDPMKALVMHETGGPDVLHLEEVERPEPSDREVLVRVRAASVNPVDWKYRRGLSEKQLPAVLGNDISGTVETPRAAGFGDGE